MSTYWDNTGRYQDLALALQKLVPASGPVEKYWKNKELERFRKASCAYYDTFNNGGCNRMKSISRFFGADVTSWLRLMWSNRKHFNGLNGWDKIHKYTEPKMDEIILAAAREQGLLT